MIRKDKTDSNYVLVDHADLLIGANAANKLHNKEMFDVISDLFSIYDEDTVEINQKNYKKIKKDSEVVRFLIKKANITDYETFIDVNTLKDAYVRAYYEFNHEMKNILAFYLRKYIDNEINDIDNEYLRAEIINDKPLIEYIKKYDNFTSYIDEKIEKSIDMKEKIKRN